MAAPTVTSFTPSSGSTLGGTFVAIVGTNFVPGLTTVAFGVVAATTVDVQSLTHLTCVAPAKAAGAATVKVTTTLGTGTAPSTFTYVVPATDTQWTLPRSINTLAGLLVTTHVRFSAQAAANSWASVTGFDLVGALNQKAGTTNLDLNAVCNKLATTTNMDAQQAMTILAHV